jgi:hypothetical protein
MQDLERQALACDMGRVQNLHCLFLVSEVGKEIVISTSAVKIRGMAGRCLEIPDGRLTRTAELGNEMTTRLLA